MKYIILCGSVTRAFAAAEAMKKSGLAANVGRARAEITAKHGCSYTLETSASPSAVKAALSRAKIKPTHVYTALPDGRLMEVSL